MNTAVLKSRGARLAAGMPETNATEPSGAPRPERPKAAKWVLLTSSKGGSGKTTTAYNLAAVAANDGLRVGVVDLDIQGALTQWWRLRPPEAPPIRHFHATMDSFQGALDKAAAVELDLVIIDTESMQTRGGQSGCPCHDLLALGGTEARIALPKGILERVVQNRRADIQKGLHCRPGPAHLLRLVHPLGHDLVHRALDERGRDRLPAPTPGGIGHQRSRIALEVAQQAGDVALEAVNPSRLIHLLASGPAEQGGEPVPASCPAPMPQAPLRAFQIAHGVADEGRLKVAGRLQRVLKAHRGVPLIEHGHGARQHLALQPPQPGIAVAQHCGRRVRGHARCGKRLPEGLGRSRLAIPGEGEAVLDAVGTDHLARDHLEVA